MEASAPAKPLAQAAPDTGTRSQTGALPNLIVIGAQKCGGVDPDFTHPRFEHERHQTARKTRAARVAMRQDAERLRELTGRSFENWTIRDT
jgi:hypothetical protein